MIIAIDGPAASGKSSVSRGVASALGFLFVSSGHFYRAMAWGAVRDAITAAEEEAVKNWIVAKKLTLTESSDGITLSLDGMDATTHLSDPAVAAMVSKLAAFPIVRDTVNARLRALAESHDLVMEGRDIGTNVFPETDYKFYLDATLAERSARRAADGVNENLAARDQRDSQRAVAPLMIALGAKVINNSALTSEQTSQLLLEEIHKLMAANR